MKRNDIILNSGLAAYNVDDINRKPLTNNSILKASIVNRLKRDSPALVENIKFTVNKGIISLTGTVPLGYQKLLIASIIIQVDGVKEVINKITVAKNP